MKNATCKWEVLTVFAGFEENCWHDEEGEPITFNTRKEAAAALAEHLADLREAGMGARRADFRIARVGEEL